MRSMLRSPFGWTTSSTLMRLIIEEWVEAHRDGPAPSRLGELMRHLDAARQAAAALGEQAA